MPMGASTVCFTVGVCHVRFLTAFPCPLTGTHTHTDRSSRKLDDTKQEMDTISSNVKVSHSLITKFGRREITDRLLIFLGLVLFFGVVLYIIRKRLIGWII